MRKRIYLLPDFMDWHNSSEGGELLDLGEWRRGHDIWEHAQLKLHQNATEMDRVDAITTLKRCLNQRLKEIEKAYKLKGLFNTNKKYLQLLEQCGLVRPLILQDLMEIRNLIEHEDKRPPKLDRCLELLDVIWYFLRATDSITRLRIDSMIFEAGNGPYWISANIHIKRRWKFELRGWLPEDHLLPAAVPGAIEMMVEGLHTFKEWKERGKSFNLTEERVETDVYTSGEVVTFPDKLAFIKKYFAAF
jgi:hypothetical protein